MKYRKRIIHFAFSNVNQSRRLGSFLKLNLFFLVVLSIDCVPDLLNILFFLYLHYIKMYHYLEINLYFIRNEKHLSYKKKIHNFIIPAWACYHCNSRPSNTQKKFHKGYTGARRYLCLPKQF